jgi:hypothetical protein
MERSGDRNAQTVAPFEELFESELEVTDGPRQVSEEQQVMVNAALGILRQAGLDLADLAAIRHQVAFREVGGRDVALAQKRRQMGRWMLE